MILPVVLLLRLNAKAMFFSVKIISGLFSESRVPKFCNNLIYTLGSKGNVRAFMCGGWRRVRCLGELEAGGRNDASYSAKKEDIQTYINKGRGRNTGGEHGTGRD